MKSNRLPGLKKNSRSTIQLHFSSRLYSLISDPFAYKVQYGRYSSLSGYQVPAEVLDPQVLRPFSRGNPDSVQEFPLPFCNIVQLPLQKERAAAAFFDQSFRHQRLPHPRLTIKQQPFRCRPSTGCMPPGFSGYH